MFKIVETIEKGNRELTVVPKSWEQCGTLFWPKKFAYKYQQDPESTPDSNWMSIPCKMKRQGFASFKTAEAELTEMIGTNESTTENEEQQRTTTMLRRPRRAVKVLLPKSTQLSTDLNDLAASCTVSLNNEQENYVQQTSVHQTYFDNFTVPFEMGYPEESNNHQNYVTNDNVRVLGSSDELSNELPSENFVILQNENDKKFDLILTKLDRLELNQERILKQLACFQVLLEKATCKTNSIENRNRSDKNQQALAIEPINNKEGIEKFNDVLKNTDTFSEYEDALSIICGVNTKTKAIDHCYMLVDKFFTRHFFTLCSWAGGSKVQSNTKFAFKFYENVIALFFKLIHKADPHFSLGECEEFFKGVIRNCMRRNTSANIRTSKGKRRPKKLSYNADNANQERKENEQNEDKEDEQETEVNNNINVDS